MYWNDLCDWTLWALVGLQMVDPSFRVVTNHKSPFNVLGGSTVIKWTNVPELWLHLTADSVSFSIKGPIEGSKHLQCQQSKERQVGSGGSKIHVSCQEGGWYLISGLGNKISCWKFIESGKNSYYMMFFSFIAIQGLFWCKINILIYHYINSCKLIVAISKPFFFGKVRKVWHADWWTKRRTVKSSLLWILKIEFLVPHIALQLTTCSI